MSLRVYATWLDEGSVVEPYKVCETQECRNEVQQVVRSEGRALDKLTQGRQCSNQLVMYRHSAAGAASPPAPVLTEKGLWMRGRGEVHFDVRRKAVLGGGGGRG